MADQSSKIVTVFGGSGFLGRHVVRALAKRGYRVRIAVRRPELAGFMQPQGGVGQIFPVQANLRHDWSIERAIEGADAVVNLVGILFETSKQSFDAIHKGGAAAIAKATKKAGLSNMVQISAIGANLDSASGYARSKAAGEQAVLATIPEAVIIRPSLLIGPDDDFFNKFAQMSRFSPALPLIGGGETKFQPAFVGDVAEVIARAIDGELEEGQIYELGGPQAKSFKELLQIMLKETQRKRLLIPMPFAAAKALAWWAEMLPTPVLTGDQVILLQSDNVVSEDARAAGRTFEGLGISPQAVEAVVGSYLWSYRPSGQYEANRRR
ncbi:MAG: complex I NDUFA9 subunit family protein [Cohaesibacter sp.]|nr:complex I NDUFA9 subunit family protein [Cohaesibacter sp.]